MSLLFHASPVKRKNRGREGSRSSDSGHLLTIQGNAPDVQRCQVQASTCRAINSVCLPVGVLLLHGPSIFIHAHPPGASHETGGCTHALVQEVQESSPFYVDLDLALKSAALAVVTAAATLSPAGDCSQSRK